MPDRTVFFVSDGTGITAETFGNAILAQFDFQPRHVRLPFVDTPTEKIWMNGELVDWDAAQVHILTHSLHYGMGVF